MAFIELKHIKKIYPNGYEAIKDFSLDIDNNEFVVFVGPSGCGKSTILRMIAGLEEITDGDFYIDGEIMNDEDPKDRNIAMVFQNYALYPHLTVRKNIAFPLINQKIPFKHFFSIKYRKERRKNIREQVEKAAEIIGLTQYLDVYPRNLSGGQKQRVALGRSIVRNPKVFLLDEPLSNLDAKMRGQMRSEISKLHKKLKTVFIYVTHDQIEAMTMGTKIVVMKDGWIQQVASSEELFENPVNKFVAGFIGTPPMNFLDATYKNGTLIFKNAAELHLNSEQIKKHDEFYRNKYNELCKNYPIFELQRRSEFEKKNSGNKHPVAYNPEEDEAIKRYVEYMNKVASIINGNSHEITFGIRPRSILLKTDYEYEEQNILANVALVERLGEEVLLYVSLINDEKEFILSTNFTNKNVEGDKISISFNKNSIYLFDVDTEESILKHEK